MRKFLKFSVLIIFLIFFLSFFSSIINAEDNICDKDPKDLNESQLSTCIDQLSKSMNLSKTATQGVQDQINGIKSRVAFIENDLIIKQKNIDNGYKELTKITEILNKAIRDYYIKSYYNSPLVVFLSAASASEITQLLAYQKAATDQDKVIITNIALSIQDLETKRKNLKTEQENLAVVKEKLDKVVAEAKTYQANLSGKIAGLSARQREILNQRLSALNIPRSAGSGGACSSDLTNGKSANFSGGFGFFTYGVPNRVGLSQYGAFGRSKDGKSAEDILQAYYSNYELKKDYSQDITINVESGPSLKIEEYLRHLGEMPESWGNDGGFEALKAQATAARSYALAYTSNGQGTICGTDSCQVYLPNEKGGKWNEAVEATKGWVMVQGGQPIKAWFSSTHGGYIHSSGDIGWSGTSWTKNAQDIIGNVSSFSDLKDNAYDGPSHGNSPSFYCDWGARSGNYGGTAWLRPDETADIVNAVKLASLDASTGCFLFQTDKAPPAADPQKGCPETGNWSSDTVKQKLRDKGATPFDSVSNISVDDVDWGSGKTSTIRINGNTSDSFSGGFFKDYFNLRAPANIQIVGPLYNVERQ
ncbi:MAG: hypothetical protein HW400_465 [Candidatus Levybacteria bacterium]|nr:hypothetical protein [Candidatus Levybacteria bacterium]